MLKGLLLVNLVDSILLCSVQKSDVGFTESQMRKGIDFQKSCADDSSMNFEEEKIDYMKDEEYDNNDAMEMNGDDDGNGEACQDADHSDSGATTGMGIHSMPVTSLLEDNDSIIAVKDGRVYNNQIGGNASNSPKKMPAAKLNR